MPIAPALSPHEQSRANADDVPYARPGGRARRFASGTLPDVCRLLVRGVLVPSWAAMLAVLLLAPFSRGLPPWALFGPFVLSLALLGLPHGALDFGASRSNRDRSACADAVPRAFNGGVNVCT